MTDRRDFLKLAGVAAFGANWMRNAPAADVTAATARECGLPVDVVAEEYTVDGLVRALQVYALEG